MCKVLQILCVYSFTDINECLTDLHNCSLDDGEECVNIPGSFLCKLSLKCPKNYAYNTLSLKCEGKFILK